MGCVAHGEALNSPSGRHDFASVRDAGRTAATATRHLAAKRPQIPTIVVRRDIRRSDGPRLVPRLSPFHARTFRQRSPTRRSARRAVGRISRRSLPRTCDRPDDGAIALPIILFVLACLSTFWSGVKHWAFFMPLSGGVSYRWLVVAHWPDGLVYMASVIGILLAHELGHFIATVICRNSCQPTLFHSLAVFTHRDDGSRDRNGWPSSESPADLRHWDRRPAGGTRLFDPLLVGGRDAARSDDSPFRRRGL